MHIFLIGFMGSGKSFWGRLLADRLGMPYADLDVAIEEHYHQTIPQLFEQEGELHFRQLERQMLEHISARALAHVISCGGGTPCFFDNIQCMKEKGLVIWLNAREETLVKRLVPEKLQRPLLRGLSDAQLSTYVHQKLKERLPYYQAADVAVQEDEQTIDHFIQLIQHAK